MLAATSHLARGLVGAILAMAIGGAASAAILHVDSAAPDSGDGLTWRTAFSRVQSALAVAQPGDEVRVAAGTYRPTDGSDRFASFAVPSGVALLGGFDGYYASGGAGDPDQRDIVANPTILSGNIGSQASSSDNSFHVVSLAAAASSTLVEGFTIQEGRAAGGPADDTRGAGVRILGGAPLLRACTIQLNFASESGSAIHCTGAPTIEACTIRQNSNDNLKPGGALSSIDGAPVLVGCQFVNNDGAFVAGAVHVDGGSIDASGCLFDDNDTQGVGGIEAIDAALTVVGCTFKNGSSGLNFKGTSSGSVSGCTFSAGGIGIAFESSQPVEVTDCLFSANVSEKGGAGARGWGPTAFRACRFHQNTSTPGSGSESRGGAVLVITTAFILDPGPTFVGCDFVANVASGTGIARGGGMAIDGVATIVGCRFLGNSGREGGAISIGSNGFATVVSSEFSGNIATQRGGAIHSNAGTLDAINCTIATNSAAVQAGGVYLTGANPDTTLGNTILWGNTVGGQPTLAAQLVDAAPGVPSVDHCCVQGLGAATLGGVGNFGLDPGLVDPDGADGIAGTDDDDLSIGDLSPCIDAGCNALVPLDSADADDDATWSELTPIDVAASPRFAGARPAPAGAVVDVGASEVVASVAQPAFADLDGDGALGGGDLGLILDGWGSCATGCCPSDLTGDGLVNAADLALLLAAWNQEEQP